MDESKHILKHMGSKIRNLRMGRGWKLGELSEKSGISMAMLSKIENGRVYPTFPTLLRVLKTLEVDLNAFFEDMSMNTDFPGYIFHKREDYTEITKEDSIGFRYENILTQSLSGISLEVSLLTLSKGAERELLTTDGFEYIFLVKGDINYVLDNKTFHLREGDSLYFDGRLPHVPKNNLESEAILLVVYFITEL
ncbi:helix-turn-helix domain-containing protein [Flagellimonas olearia]|uniref:Helix-turn-helix domain-containing protein n=1 Tax=Flagellimonas olearia TaxID=552546 RepID=A0A6I1DXY2_9FLAO|nr:XRE family transcriptional regulator [Allomuricauda olearia]KAB7529399.1 helix-turn-helix domain-containing protein [Allomuricauda olearia]